MSNYNSLKTTIDANIKQNGNQEITGQILNSVLNQMVTTLGAEYQFAGVAKIDTNPGTPDAKVFYIANGKGTYTNFGGLEVTEDDVVVLYWDSSWHKEATGIASNEKLSELGQYVENQEWVRVVTDSDGKILYGVKTDGKFYFGDGCPPQVQEYVQNIIDGLSLDEYEDIVAFLADLEKGDETLQDLLDKKVDGEYVENLEYIEVKTDAEDKILEATEKDGTKVFGGDVKILGNMEVSGVSYKVIENPEYLAAWVDAEGKVIFGFKTDGKTYVGDADFVNGIDWDVLSSITAVENPEFIEAKTDSEGKLLAGRTSDGAAFEKVGFSTPKVSIDGYIIENTEDPERRSEINTDSEGKILSYRDADGVKHEEAGIHLNAEGLIRLKNQLEKGGYLGTSNWSDKSYIYIPTIPTCAVINISGIYQFPTVKNSNLHAWFEFWDMNGNYFKKKVILDAQGRSSLNQYKRNFAIDFCEDDWVGDETTTIKIGDWVSQDGFHFKAYYTDLFKFANITSYKLWESFKNNRPMVANKPYKSKFINNYTSTSSNVSNFTQNVKDEAKCVPDGFPVMVYLNDEFYGLFSWQLKKHRDNYMLDRNSTDNIHIDGDDYLNLFNGIVNWEHNEIRNPKPKKSKWTLYDMDGKKYNGDNPKELIDNTSTKWDGTNISHIKSAQVKDNIIALSKYMAEIAVYEASYKNASVEDKPAALATLKSEIGKRFGVEWIIDYLILINVSLNYDSIDNNTQWITWGEKTDGKQKWIPCPYDCDFGYGINAVLSYSFTDNAFLMVGGKTNTPYRLVYTYYETELKERYTQLRKDNIISTEAIYSIINKWVKGIGYDNYELEYNKWNESPCNRASELNDVWEQLSDSYITYNDIATNWDASYNYAAGKMTKYNHRCYVSLQNNNIGNIPDSDTSHWRDISVKPGTYNQGDEVWDGYGNFYKFRAKSTIIVTEDDSSKRYDHFLNTPFLKLYNHYPCEGGVYDSLYRIYKWIDKQINLIDTYWYINN